MTDQLSIAQVQQFFPDFSEPDLQQAIATQGRIHRFREGDVIMDYGGYVRMLPLILNGTIKISRLGDDGSELFLYYLTRGESCTMTFSCCMNDKLSEIQAIAEEDTTILGLPQQVLDQWMMQFKSWKNFVLTAYDRRMNEMISTIDQIAFQQLDTRLLDYLKRRSQIHQDATLNATHQKIAADLNVSREAISRLLKTMEKQGTIELGRNRVRLMRE
ncbi:Crp/Fnr family transcriptional regulator [Neolewinella lacunae]|uniref:Crp/Fnr family transcriptional regulator n=1 Tax=Neolewinella lacunae TaxID=1517758 RepID=A0A923T6T3_9BACT|nr:Crp/Fnr family transcriptional regulator [Neolewinella lacunae]MBC6992921.1 Crp/Fnr family transcriptional regulator [Neolewinella lacunae]MDN3633715.1 Crp/Fnr family transcriptional regulator [Neolewinella lacunae]